MDMIFLKLLNMSIAASWPIIAVILLRLLLKKAPKWLTCMLWAVVAVRLLCPFSFESPFSLVPSAETFQPSVVQYAQKPAIDSGISFINSTLNPVISETFEAAPYASANPLHILMFIAGNVWGIGMICLLVYALVGFLCIRRKMREAVHLRDNIWLCDSVKSPFIVGIARPRIYLSSAIDEERMKYVLAHEQAHLKRKDHWWKPLGYLLLAVYWFNPLMWAAYILFCRDIELACDEKVIKDMDMDGKKAYSRVLVDCSMQQKIVMVCPLAFGEVSVRARVKAVLNYKKPAFWMIAIAIMVCVVVTVCFLTNPKQDVNNVNTIKNQDLAGNDSSLTEDNGNLYSTDELPEKTTDVSLDAAISAAILERNKSAYTDEADFVCCDFLNLEILFATPAAGDTTHTIVCYGWALYKEYNISEEGIEDIAGSHIPVALTFELNENSYILKEYWQPRDGSYYVPDIREKFPVHIADDGIDSQKYIYRQIQSCYKQAVQFSGLDTDAVISGLLDTICSSPGTSSNPQDYIDAHSIAYRELLYYGEYTLQYCFERFGQGKETGLEGKIMAIACEELLQTKGKIPVDAGTAESGQFWFDTLLAHAGNLVEPYLER